VERIILRIEGLFYLKSELFYLHSFTSSFLHYYYDRISKVNLNSLRRAEITQSATLRVEVGSVWE